MKKKDMQLKLNALEIRVQALENMDYVKNNNNMEEMKYVKKENTMLRKKIDELKKIIKGEKNEKKIYR